MEPAVQDLLDLTSLPTAAGREGRVIAWVREWASRHRDLVLHRDEHGNLLLQRLGVSSDRPILFTAHLDHPAFVVTDIEGGNDSIRAEFRGGVGDMYFEDAPVQWHGRDSMTATGRVLSASPSDDGIRQATLRLDPTATPQPGDVVTWDLPPSSLDGDLVHAPACDDLAPAAAALAALAELGEAAADGPPPDVRVLLTRAEEVGFVGAIAACHSGIIPEGSRIFALEASRSFADSPIGGGPIVRVGDRTSTFDPALTRAADRVARRLADADASFEYQRKLMPGGTCEATAFCHLGHTATCLCLPLGNYHNQNETTGRIDSESISLSDYHGLIRLLTTLARDVDTQSEDPLTASLNNRFQKHRHLLG